MQVQTSSHSWLQQQTFTAFECRQLAHERSHGALISQTLEADAFMRIRTVLFNINMQYFQYDADIDGLYSLEMHEVKRGQPLVLPARDAANNLAVKFYVLIPVTEDDKVRVHTVHSDSRQHINVSDGDMLVMSGMDGLCTMSRHRYNNYKALYGRVYGPMWK